MLQRPAALAARARGLPASRVVWRHAWRQSLGPVLAVYGVIVGSLFSGSFAVELVTSWPGLGDLMRNALQAGARSITVRTRAEHGSGLGGRAV